MVLCIELEDLGRQEVDRDRVRHAGPVLPEGVIHGREGQDGRSVMELQGGGVHGDGNRLATDARFRIVDGGKNAGLVVLGDDDFRTAKTPAGIGKGDVQMLFDGR